MSTGDVLPGNLRHRAPAFVSPDPLNDEVDGTTTVALIIMHLAAFAIIMASLTGLNLLRR